MFIVGCLCRTDKKKNCGPQLQNKNASKKGCLFHLFLYQTMTIHAGIYQQKSENTIYVSTFDTNTQISSVFSIHQTSENEQFDFSIIFDEIRSTFQDELGCCCTYLDENYDNEYRKECIDLGAAFGFKNVEILNFYGNQYLQAIFNANYSFNDNEAIWIAELDGTYVWEKVNGKAQFVVWLPWSPSTKTEFNKFEVAAGVHKSPSVIFCNPEIEVDYRLMVEYLPNAQVVICERFPNLNIPLIKARIMAGDQQVTDYDFLNPMRSEVSIRYANKEVISFSEFQKLPCEKSIKIVKIDDEKFFKIFRGKHIDLISLPKFNRFLLIVAFDVNEIYNFTFQELPQCSVDTEFEISYLKLLNKATNELPSLKISKKYEFLSKNVLINDTFINAVGIDFGTASCYAAVNRLNGIEAIALDNMGQRNLASYVSFDEETPKCGKIVIDRLRHHSKSSVYDLKHIVGKNFDNIAINNTWPFRILPVEDNNFRIEFQNHSQTISKYSEEMLSVLFKTIKNEAEKFKGRELTEAVVAFPYNFKERQISGLYAAAVLGGWKSVHLLPEPIAAIFGYSLQTTISNLNTVLVVDFGGGSFDTCIFKVINEEIVVLSYQSKESVSGKVLDLFVAKYFEDKLIKDCGIHIDETKRFKLMAESQRVKEDLSFMEKAEIDVEEIDISQPEKHICITRTEFDYLTSNLRDEIKSLIQESIAKAKVSHIDKILYVGGGCRMPMIKNLLKEMFMTSEHCCCTHPDEIIAIGAAYYAYYLNLSTRQICDAGLNNTAVFDIMRFVLKQPHLIKRLLKNEI